MTRNELISAIWRGRDPFEGFPANLYRQDLQGWRSQHGLLSRSIEETKPHVIVEVGAWKGASSLFMARTLKQLEIPGTVIAVDTWLGSSDHWESDKWFAELCYEGGFPSLWKKFYANVIESGLRDYVVPLPLDSIGAAHYLKKIGIRPEMIHIDAGHDFRSVYTDLEEWWTLLADGGVLVGDDYEPSWPGVCEAFDKFSTEKGLTLEVDTGKCRIKKN